MLSAISIEAFTPVIILTAALLWTTFPGGFTAFNAFPILALITIVQMPLFFLVDTCGNILRAWACFNRIQAYLQLLEWEDPRQLNSATTGSENESQIGIEMETLSGDRETDINYEFLEAWINPSGSPNTVLKGVSLQILKARIIAVLGPIASGKSTFLRCLLGEANIPRGSLRITKKGMTVAFCDQTPWLNNGTLQENILGANPYDERWYRTVAKRCQLVQDFAQLPNGDQTLVGSDGMNLSVGQRHRVSLARAVFTRADVIVIDDIFSSQDQATTTEIVKQLLGPNGLLRQSETTVVVATHLSVVLDASDEALVTDGEGSISQRAGVDRASLKKELATVIDVPQNTPGNITEAGSEARIGSMNRSENEPRARVPTATAANDARTRGDFGLYRFYFRAISKSWLLLWITSMAIVTFCDNFPSMYFCSNRMPNN